MNLVQAFWICPEAVIHEGGWAVTPCVNVDLGSPQCPGALTLQHPRRGGRRAGHAASTSAQSICHPVLPKGRAPLANREGILPLK